MNTKREISSITIDEAKELLKDLFEISNNEDILSFNFKANSSNIEIEAAIDRDIYENVYISLSNEDITIYIEDDMLGSSPVTIPFKLFKYLEEHFNINY